MTLYAHPVFAFWVAEARDIITETVFLISLPDARDEGVAFERIRDMYPEAIIRIPATKEVRDAV